MPRKVSPRKESLEINHPPFQLEGQLLEEAKQTRLRLLACISEKKHVPGVGGLVKLASEIVRMPKYDPTVSVTPEAESVKVSEN